VYPPIAKQAHVQGAVVLHAIIGKDGRIKNLQVQSGNAMLTQAAIDAVQNWRYKPFILSGEPTEVETTVTVNFSFGGGA
jgi:protein TonB